MTAVLVFFYGSYMNRAVLAEAGMAPKRWEPATLSGFDIRIAPRANLERARDGIVFGVLASATHEELERLYTHAQTVLGEIYLPEAILVRVGEAGYEPALCYISRDMKAAPADPAYVERILGPARELGFPSWYVARLESFIPQEKETSR